MKPPGREYSNSDRVGKEQNSMMIGETKKR